MTVEEWADLPDDVRGELVNGQLVEEEMADFVHEAVLVYLLCCLREWAVRRDGRVYGSEGKFALGPRHGRKPDLSVFLNGRRPVAEGAAFAPPDFMVEVISPRPRDARRDRIEKAVEYAAFGVRQYWLVDPRLRTLEILVLGKRGRYELALGASSGKLDRVPGCPGLSLDLDAMWAEIAELSRRPAAPKPRRPARRSRRRA